MWAKALHLLIQQMFGENLLCARHIVFFLFLSGLHFISRNCSFGLNTLWSCYTSSAFGFLSAVTNQSISQSILIDHQSNALCYEGYKDGEIKSTFTNHLLLPFIISEH